MLCMKSAGEELKKTVTKVNGYENICVFNFVYNFAISKLELTVVSGEHWKTSVAANRNGSF